MPEFNSYDYLYSYYTIYLNVSCDEVFSSTDPFLYRFACSMAEVNNVLYIATTTGIVILDVSNIYSPTSIGFWSDPVGADYYLRMVNGMLYATGGIGFLVFNITNASSPEVLSRISANYGKFELVQGFLYITSSLTTAVSMPLMIFDLNLIIQDPPGILESTSTIVDLTMSQSTVFVLSIDNTLLVFLILFVLLCVGHCSWWE